MNVFIVLSPVIEIVTVAVNALGEGRKDRYFGHQVYEDTIKELLGRRHNTECLESGTVIIECKDGKCEPLGEEDVRKF